MTKRIFFQVVGVLAFGAASMAAIPAAHACKGVIATVLNRCELDTIHKAIGSPLNNLVPQAPIGAPAHSGPSMQPPMQLPMQPPMQMALGNVCVTNQGAVYGPANPIGSTCFVATPYGPIPGIVH